MSFHDNGYLSWYMPRIRADDGAINLHASGVPSLTLDDVRFPDLDPWSAVPAFEEKLASWLGVPVKELLFTPGATGGTLLALLALTEPGDGILLERPIYEPMMRQAERLGQVDRFSRRASEGWTLPVDEVRDLMNDGTRLVMITEPANPSGTCALREDILAVADEAARHDAWLLVNEVYRGFTQNPSLHGARENILVVSSFSKLLGAYWMRLGWVSGPAEIVSRLQMAHMNFSMATKPAAALGLSLLDRADELRQRAISRSALGREVVGRWVDSVDGLSWTPPEGPGFGCVFLPDHAGDDVQFVQRAHRDHGVLAVPGTFFEVPGSMRISWLQAGAKLEEGLDRLGRSLR